MEDINKDLVEATSAIREAADKMEAERKTFGDIAAETKAQEARANARIDAIEAEQKALALKVARADRFEQAKDGKSREQIVAERSAFLEFALKGGNGLTKTFSPTGEKVLSVADATTGGIFAMPEILAGLDRAQVEVSPFRQNAKVRTTSRESVRLRKEISAGSYGWTGEQTTRSETTNPRYGWENVPVHEIYAMIDITRWDLEDTDFDWEGELSYQAATQFAKAEGAAFHSGDGVGKPFGFIGVPGTSTLGNDTFTGDDLIEMVAVPKSNYMANAKWYMNRSTIAACRKLKGSTNDHYLWQPGLNGGTPAMILGFPIVEAVDMADVGSVTKPIAFGDFRAHYTVIDRLDMQVQRDDITQAATGAVRFWFRRRVGGQSVNVESMVVGVTT
jgi:HK97 family phage major capsid protein